MHEISYILVSNTVLFQCKFKPHILFLFPGGASGLQSEQLDKGQNAISEDTEMAVDALDASCILKSTAQDTTVATGQSQDRTKGQCGC